MKFVLVLIAVLGFAAADSDDSFCYKNVLTACTPGSNDEANELKRCNAKYGSIDLVESKLAAYANTHITRSFDFLLMSTYFGNFQKDRVGFEQLFRKLSDATWNDAIDLVKYIAKRGGKMKFTPQSSSYSTVEVDELHGMSRALDIEKGLALEAHSIHKEVTRLKEKHHDPEIGSFLENHFVHQQAQTIRDLSGHTNDLKHLMALDGNKDNSLSLFLFDEYLQKL